MKQKLLMVLILSGLLSSVILGIWYKENHKTDVNPYVKVSDYLGLENRLREGDKKFELLEVPEVEEEVTYLPKETYYGLTEDELNLVYAVVMQEGGPTYESAEAVMSTIVNRVNNPAKWGWAGDTIIDQITYPQQYCYSLDDYWVKYLDGNVPDTVKWAVQSVLEFGAVNNYDCFRGYYLEDCEYIGGNWYFVG